MTTRRNFLKASFALLTAAGVPLSSIALPSGLGKTNEWTWKCVFDTSDGPVEVFNYDPQVLMLGTTTFRFNLAVSDRSLGPLTVYGAAIQPSGNDLKKIRVTTERPLFPIKLRPGDTMHFDYHLKVDWPCLNHV